MIGPRRDRDLWDTGPTHPPGPPLSWWTWAMFVLGVAAVVGVLCLAHGAMPWLWGRS